MDNEAMEQDVLTPANGDKVEDGLPLRPNPNPVKPDAGEAVTGADARSDTSSVSSVNPDMLGDEIIVGLHETGDKASPLRVVSDNEDGDVARDDEPVSHYPKRKRASVYNDLAEDKMDIISIEDPIEETRSRKKSTPQPKPDFKGVLLGYWRDSPVPDVKGKHSVWGFMDVKDRLRIKIRTFTRTGEPINSHLYPLPPGPGGSWLTFERIVFADHLVGLDHTEIKEYVKIRWESLGNNAPEDEHEVEQEAVREARRRLRRYPKPNPLANSTPLIIAYGEHIPDQGPVGKRRRTDSAANTIADRPDYSPLLSQSRLQPPNHPENTSPQSTPSGPASVQPPQPIILDALRGTRPTRILIGSWSKSDVQDESERHAVYGILGANDMFRVKLVRETLDGRYKDGNFPAGAGALWIPYEDVIFLRHIEHLSRPEMKEYVRVRQSQIDAGEKEDEKISNETKAVYEAQTRVSVLNKGQLSGHTIPHPPIRTEREEAHAGSSSTGGHGVYGGHELRHPRREPMPRNNEPQASRQPLPSAQPSRPAGIDPVERIQNLAEREVSRMEAVQQRHERLQQSSSQRPPMDNPYNPPPQQSMGQHHMERQRFGPPQPLPQFQEARDRMQKIWQNQEQARVRVGPVPAPVPSPAPAPAHSPSPSSQDVKIHMNVKYERKQSGPFAGKHVSQGAIITIDGEDYVEYRVLTKPSFF